MISELNIVLAANSGDAVWDLYLGDTPEDCLRDTTAFATGTVSAGRNHTKRPRGRATYAAIKLYQSTGADPWVLEQITAIVQKYGRSRKFS